MRRRPFVLSMIAAALPAASVPLARAHHGWSSFDQSRPLYLEGTAARVRWRNPHAELDLDVEPGLRLPADLATRTVPAQAAPVDGPALLRAAQLPVRRDRRWLVELAPLSRLEAWRVPEPKPGERLAVVGFTFTGEKGDAVLRAEYLFLGGTVFGLRSSPA
jgi:hypothetical protein